MIAPVVMTTLILLQLSQTCSLGHPVDIQSAAAAMVLNVYSLDCDVVKASSPSLSQPSFMEKHIMSSIIAHEWLWSLRSS